MHLDSIHLDLLVTIIVSLSGTGVILWRVFTHMACRDACLRILSARIDEANENLGEVRASLQREICRSGQIHDSMYQRVNHIDKNVAQIIGHLGIPDK